MATPRYAQQQLPYGAPQAYGQPELQGQQGYAPESQGYGQEHQGYGEEDAQYEHQGYEHEESEEQYAQNPQDPNFQQANGESGVKGLPEQTNPEIPPQVDDPQPAEAEVGAHSEKTQASFQPRRHFPQDPHHSKLMSHFHDIAGKRLSQQTSLAPQLTSPVLQSTVSPMTTSTA